MAKHLKIDMPDPLSCVQDPQALLAKALENRNIDDFKIALSMDADPTRMDSVTNISLFEKAIQTPGCSEFVKECIRRGCKCDYINRNKNKSPINYAADSKDHKIMEIILQLPNIPVNTKYYNLTPLNSLAKNLNQENFENSFKCMKLLIKYGANPNIPEIDSQNTPILYIIKNKKLNVDQKEEIIKFFLENSDNDLDTFRDGEARTLISKLFPNIELPPSELITELNVEALSTLLHNEKEDKFIKAFTDYQSKMSDHDNEKNTLKSDNLRLLIDAIKNGLNDAVDVILNTKLDINSKYGNNSPIKISCIWGNWNALEKLLNHKDIQININDILLITVVKKLDEDDYPTNKFSNYHMCFYTLLNSGKIDVNELDDSGSSALHFAVKYKNEKAIKELLNRGAYMGTKSEFNDLPITDINPKILEEYFDSCITTNNSKPGDPNFEIIINYKNLVPIQSNENIIKNKITYVKNEMIPIEHMAESKELRHLLKHPLITSFLFLKWHRLSMIFYINFILYTIFCASLIIFIILKFNNTTNDTIVTIFYLLSICGLLYMIIREIIQLIISPKGFIINVVNYLEIALIILTIITLSNPNYETETQRLYAVGTILLASVELCLLVGSLPVLSISTHMLMLREVSRSFLKILTLYSIFIITFSLCFYILFGKPETLLLNETANYATEKIKENVTDNNEKDEKKICCKENNEDDDSEFKNFSNPFTAIIRTIVMLTGEFDAGDIKFNSYYSYLVFLLFVFFMSIVLFNLLNGLAVSDTQIIKSQAELNGSICRTYILSSYERALAGKSGKAAFLVNHEPFRSICKRLTNIFPDCICGNRIFILPNNSNKILIPKDKTNGLELTQIDRTNEMLLPIDDNYDIENKCERKMLDPPVQLLPCCCSCITGKCSEMDVRTVKTALAVIEKKETNSKEEKKIEESEHRLTKIENKLENIFQLLKELSDRKNKV